MKEFLIRYRTHPEKAAENQAAIEAVFAELREARLPGIRYRVMRGPNDTFFHFVQQEDDGPSPLEALAAFRAFQAGVRARCVEPPTRTDLTVVGAY